MTQVQLGEVPTVEHRDAVHVAVIPVVAGCDLSPGERVGLEGGKACRNPDSPIVGIVDPYREDLIRRGTRFYLCLLPNTVVGMRHHWGHPSFPDIDRTPARNDSETWLRAYAMSMNTYDENADKAFARLISGLLNKDLFAYGTDLHGLYDLDRADELKRHAERYLGVPIDWSQFEFTCSC